MAVGFNYAQFGNNLVNIANASSTAYGLADRLSSNLSGLSNALFGLYGSGQLGGSYLNGTNFNNLSGEKPTEWLISYINNAYSENGILRYMYKTLFHDYNPDISGYTLLFMSPPVLSGYLDVGNANYDVTSRSSFLSTTSQLFPLIATQYTPPSIQLNTGTLAGSSGTQHYATELNITDNMSITFLETMNLDIYTLHKTWIQYIYQILEGTLEPSSDYLENRTIDYAASFYFVKFKPNVSEIQYIGKAIGCFPKELPTPDLVGNKSSNELTSLSFNYTVSDYRETTAHETGHWLYSELQNLILSQYGNPYIYTFNT